MKNNLRISNMIMTGKMPFKKKLNEIEVTRLINNCDWMLINEEISPILSKTMPIRKYPKLSVHGKIKQPYVSIWTSGSINILGIINKEEGNKVYDLVMNDLKKYCKRVLK